MGARRRDFCPVGRCSLPPVSWALCGTRLRLGVPSGPAGVAQVGCRWGWHSALCVGRLSACCTVILGFARMAWGPAPCLVGALAAALRPCRWLLLAWAHPSLACPAPWGSGSAHPGLALCSPVFSSIPWTHLPCPQESQSPPHTLVLVAVTRKFSWHPPRKPISCVSALCCLASSVLTTVNLTCFFPSFSC